MSCCSAVRARSWIKSTAVPESTGSGSQRESAPASLAGLRVLVTRPAHQAQALARLIEAAGGEALRLPTIEIAPPPDPGALQVLLARLQDFDIAIFVSSNAVRQAFAQLPAGGLPRALRVAAVGAGTEQALREQGITQVLAPTEQFDSEALLDLLPATAVAGKKILLVRGSAGREWLSEQLLRHGALLSHAECYQRVLPRQPDPVALARLREGQFDIVTITSVEGLHNLYTLAGQAGQALLLNMPIVAVSERQVHACRELGHHGPVQIAARATDAAIVDALRAWRAARNSI